MFGLVYPAVGLGCFHWHNSIHGAVAANWARSLCPHRKGKGSLGQVCATPGAPSRRLAFVACSAPARPKMRMCGRKYLHMHTFEVAILAVACPLAGTKRYKVSVGGKSMSAHFGACQHDQLLTDCKQLQCRSDAWICSGHRRCSVQLWRVLLSAVPPTYLLPCLICTA